MSTQLAKNLTSETDGESELVKQIDDAILEWSTNFSDIAATLGISKKVVRQRWEEKFAAPARQMIREGKTNEEITSALGIPKTAVAAFRASKTRGERNGSISEDDFDIPSSTKDNTTFSWLPFFEELLTKLCRDFNANSLAALAHQIFENSPLKDQFKDGSSGPVREIDPLTFIGYFNRSLTTDRRKSYCKAIKERLQLESAVPSDFNGIPIINNQASWFFPYEKERPSDVFERLWAFSNALNKSDMSEKVFANALNIKGVGLSKLTQICFICKPAQFLPLDKNTSEFLEKNGLREGIERIRKSESYRDYVQLLESIKSKLPGQTFAQISARSYDFESKSEETYWAVGAMWDEVDKTPEFIQNGVWINGFSEDSKDRSLNLVKQIGVGDWIAIKSSFVKEKTFPCLRIKAVGKVTENIGDGRNLKVNWLFKGPPFDVDGASYRQTVHRLDDAVDTKLIFNNSYKSSRKDKKVPSNTAVPEALPIPHNLILFGPPGVGKTHQILRLRGQFTTTGGEVAQEVRLTDWASDKSWWEVIAAALMDLGHDAAVTEIVSHPYVKAKIGLSNNKTPNNMIWHSLQTHTVDDCKTVAYKQRTEPLIFDKGEDSKWRLTGNWKETLSDFVTEVQGLSSETVTENKRYEMVTFHQSYSYEEFVEGIRPVIDDASESVRYVIESGVFKKLCEKARKDPSNSYALFIDEINRGNIAKIFGELITLIEVDKRQGKENETKVRLTYSKEEFSVPSNLFIIGTMNSVDRSIALIDLALRRRFRFQRMNPLPDLVPQEIGGIKLREIYQELNRRISVLLGEDYQIGHSYLMNINSLSDLRSVWFENILPLIQEYFFDDWNKMKALVPQFIESSDVSGIKDLGLVSTSSTRFTSSSGDDSDFADRFKRLEGFLKGA